LTVDGATGSAHDQRGTAQHAAGVALNGIDGAILRAVYATYDTDGLQLGYYGGGSRTLISGCDFSFDQVGIDQVSNSMTGIALVGDSVYGNSGAGVRTFGPEGMVIAGNH